jgi:D-glycero-D-manno-heptose 1,7-bisphosphate phosphatase
VSRLDAVFLDRDGTLNVKAPEGDYVKTPEELVLLPGAAEAVRLLNEHGVPAIVVTNQRGIALGRMTEDDLAAIHARLADELAAAGAHLDAIYHCPHDHDACDCRKPQTGMFRDAQRDRGELDFAHTAVVGDAASDMEAARRIGATGILLGVDEPTLLHAVRRLLDGR